MRPWLTLLLMLTCGQLVGCASARSDLTRLRDENAQLAETLRQDRVRLANLEEQNRQLNARLADAEKAVATLHDAGRDGVKLR